MRTKPCIRCFRMLDRSAFPRMRNNGFGKVCLECRYSQEGRNRITEEIVAEAKQLLAEGRHMADIARKFEMSAATLYPHIHPDPSRGKVIMINSPMAIWATKKISKRVTWNDPVEKLYGWLTRWESNKSNWKDALKTIGESK